MLISSLVKHRLNWWRFWSESTFCCLICDERPRTLKVPVLRLLNRRREEPSVVDIQEPDLVWASPQPPKGLVSHSEQRT